MFTEIIHLKWHIFHLKTINSTRFLQKTFRLFDNFDSNILHYINNKYYITTVMIMTHISFSKIIQVAQITK